MSSGQNTYLCYAEGVVHGCSATVLGGMEGEVRLCIKKRP